MALAPTRLIALINQKGGVGKTTSAVNLGAALALAGKRTLLVDLDPQAHLTLHVGIKYEQLDLTIYDLLTDDAVAASQVLCKVEGHDNLWVLPAHVNLAGVEAELAPKMVTGVAQRVLKKKCDALFGGGAASFDYVIIDCPPSLGLLTINALTLAREVIVPMQAHFLALQGLSKLLETIQLIRQSFNPDLSVAGVLLCMHENQTLLAQEVIADLSGFLEQAHGQDVPWRSAMVYQPPVRRNIKLAECPSFGKTIFAYEPTCHGAGDYRKLAAAVLAQGDVSRVGQVAPVIAPVGQALSLPAPTIDEQSQAPRADAPPIQTKSFAKPRAAGTRRREVVVEA